MTTVRIAHTEAWPGRRMGGRGFRISSFPVVLADDVGGRAIPVRLNGPEGHGLFRGDGDHPHPEPAEMITAGLLRAAGVTVTGADIDELDTVLTTGPRHGHDNAQATARIEFTAGSAEPRQLPVRIGGIAVCRACSGGTGRSAWRLADGRRAWRTGVRPVLVVVSPDRDPVLVRHGSFGGADLLHLVPNGP
jgi:hypothetical protein